MKKIHTYILMLFGLVSFAQENIKIYKEQDLEFQTLFGKTTKEGVNCFRIPAIITAMNGDVIAAIDERVLNCDDLRTSNDINIVIRRSEDNGKSWSKIETVIDYPYGKSASDPSMILDKITGEIFLFYNYMDLNKEKDIYYLMVVKSADNGKTWGKPVDITSQISKPEWHKDFKFITSGRGIQTNSGKLLHTLVDLNQKGVFVFGSDNHGKTWYLKNSLLSPADESKIIEIENNTWMVNSRVNNKIGYRYIHTSNDEGKTWTSKIDSTLVDSGCNAGILRYSSKEDGSSKNILIFSNANFKGTRKNMTVRLSYDEGKSWSVGKTIYTGRSEYSSLTVLKNGDIGILFEKDDYEIAFTSFSLKCLTSE